MLSCWRAVILLAFMYQLHSSQGAKNGNVINERNICSYIISYEEKLVLPFNETVKEYYTTWCLAIPPRCTTYRLKTVYLNKTVTANKTKTVFDCCKGYEKVSGFCRPICRLGCNHGECIDPEQCLCDEGWRGPFCNAECQPHRFGRGCENHCTCMHGATCDPKNGSCYCQEGYIGSQCEFPCPNNTYGLHCKEKCQCQNGAMCDVKNGFCECLPGYNGDFCEKPCVAGTHGVNCKKTCMCLNETTEVCNHTDGKCICKAGYKGDYCEKECDNFTYGIGCKNQCHCENSELCDHVTGECLCKPGWIGKNCSEKCEAGTFGENCKFKCLPCHNGSGNCDHETGNCVCPPGTTGENCELPCRDDYWGLNCSKKCICLNDGICHSVTGECLCMPGWIGKDCSQSCYPNTFGFNCSILCTCRGASTCDPVNGMCTCLEGYEGSNCERRLREELTEPGSVNIGIVIGSIAVCCMFLVIIAFIAYYMYKYCYTLFPKNLECIEGGRSTDIIVNEHFSNPIYEVPGFPEVTVSNPETQLHAAFEYGKDETEGLHSFKSFINQLTDDKFHSQNTLGIEKDACHRESNMSSFRGSKIKQTDMNDLSTTTPRESINGSIRKSANKANNSSPCTSSVENDEEYEPEGLCDFYILDDDIYKNVRYSKGQPEECIAN